MGTRTTGGRDAGEEIAAEPVPVRRPGVFGFGESARGWCFSIAGTFGRTNIGLNLSER